MPSSTEPSLTDQARHHDLRSVITHAEAEAERLLAATGTAPLDIVAWLSAHIAALDHAVYPVAKDVLPDGAEIVKTHREITGRITRTLRVIERHHSGDALASSLSSDKLFAGLRELVEEHHSAESALMDQLVEAMNAPAQAKLIVSYESALEHAPTRPHPHLSRGGLMFRIDGLRDRILDAMDGRHVPVPRLTKERIKPGRWGSYFMGQQHDEESDAS
jgi:hypothetical protein